MIFAERSVVSAAQEHEGQQARPRRMPRPPCRRVSVAVMSFVPEDFEVPRELAGEEFRLEPLGPEHNEGDYRAWTSSIAHIRATPGFEGRSWPTPDMTPEENLGDLERHAADFAGRSGFTYTVRAAGSDEIIGC